MSDRLDDIHKRIRAGADTEWLGRLETLRPARSLVDLALDWALIVGGVALAAAVPALWSWTLAFLAIGSGQYRLFVLGHEGLHGCLHPDTRTNDVLARWLIYGPLFVGFDDSRRSHLRHHRTLGTAEDPERYIHSMENKDSRGALLWFCTGLATFTTTFRKILPHGTFDDAGSLGGFLRQRVPVIVAQPLLAVALWASGLPWWSYLLFWILPIYVLVFVPDEIRTFCDHAQPQVPDEAADPRRLITHLPSAFEAWWLAPHGVHFQAEHHLWPNVPYYNLPRALERTRDVPGVEHRRGYLAFMREVWTRVPCRGEA